ncbi:DNA double-strand break repair nuclease NurA [Halomicrococcus sp. NG-SE-24]|uniref:DNA double-strand break repair nuclease NurA n=1 Tax=Halomicrococcus sp. NG-SE-24 TaxID=3436928 RepID=UPI003D95557D
MPFYPNAVLKGLQDHADEIRAFVDDDTEAVEKYRNALRDAIEEYDEGSLQADLGLERYPGALPTLEWSNHDTPTISFDEAAEWDNHEVVNEWAKGVLEDVTSIATDGSELGPIDEFTVPLGLVQVAWNANHHHKDGDYDQGVRTRILSPNAVTEESDKEDGVRYTDGRAPGHERYRDEGKTVIECIEKFADRNPPPVVIYDGPLVPTFANRYSPEVRDDYYRRTMSRVLAASEHHGVPVVGYTAGSSQTNIAKMLRRTYSDRLKGEPFVADARILDGFTDHWGDRSLAFVHRQYGTVDAMEITYRGKEYEFATDVLFGYLDIPEGDVMDCLEFPGWIQREGLVDYLFDIVRAEIGIGRGYPEIVQQADTNAVLDMEAKRRFMSLVQEFAEEEDLPIEWNAKDLSKKRRRR